MNFFVTSFLMMFFAIQLVNAFDNVILQVLLNTDGGSCEGGDWDFVSHQIYTMSINQRQLRGDNDMEQKSALDGISNAVGHKSRELTYPRYCANSCVGYAPGRCLALNCKGYRRSLMEPMRELFWSTNCENQKSEVRNLLRNIANNNQVGEDCKASLMQTPDMSCFSNVDC